MQSIKLPSFLTSTSFWLALAAGGIAFAQYKAGAIDSSQMTYCFVATLSALKVGLGLEANAAATSAPTKVGS